MTTIELANLGNAGTTIFGSHTRDYTGICVSSAGDVNGDGFEDVIVGAFGATSFTGESYLIFGAASMPAMIDPANLGTFGVTIFAAEGGDGSGALVAGAGDVNGDGFDDLLVGATQADGPNNTRNSAGECYVIFGAASLPSTINLGTLGTAGITIFGVDPNDGCARVAGAGDVNGDGFDDVILSASNADGQNNDIQGAGESYIVFGGTSLPQTIDLATLGAAGVKIYGESVLELSGTWVDGAGDVNGDGFDDVIIGAIFNNGVNSAKPHAGASFVIFGGSSLPATIDLKTLGAAGITIFGADSNDQSGRSVGGAGDVNGDGFDDLIIGANRADGAGNAKPDAGECYVIFGRASPPQVINLGSLGVAGITLFGGDAGDSAGRSVSGAGDVNGDGFDDVIIGAYHADGAGNSKTDAGESYLIFGGASPPTTINLDSLGLNGVTIYGVDANDESGNSVASAGDVNGDGFDDLFIGAVSGGGVGNSHYRAGECYILLGGLFEENEPPVFESPATFNVVENNTAVGTVVAVDADLPAQAISYSITGGVDRARFSITTGGVLTFVTAPDYEIPSDVGANRVYNVQITADDSNFGLTTQDIAVTVTPVNDNSPIFTSSATINVPENTVSVTTVVATDADLPVQTVTYSISGGIDESLFLITSGGLLQFVTAPDFENPTDSGADHVYNLQVTADDGNGALTVQNIAVDVTPVNDNLPVFNSPVSFNVPENTTAVGTTIASDADLPAQSVSYSISGGLDLTLFSITNGGVLSFILAPNFEDPADTGTNNVYDLQVTANDGQGGLTVQNIAVTVTPANDAPVFTSSPTFNIPENTSEIGIAIASDEDLPAQALTFAITGGADRDIFSITSNGTLTFVEEPDYESPADADPDNVYDVQVTVIDGAGGQTSQNIAVTVTPVNDNLPEFTSPTSFNVPENVASVGTAVATDVDLPLQTVTYSISGGADRDLFSLTSGGVLTFVTAPDLESPTDAGTNNVYDVQITANDGSGGLTVQNVAVTLTAVNDNSPVFTSATTFTVAENSTAVGTTVATDADLPVQSVSYSLSGGIDQSKFSITLSGVLTFVTAPDFENPADAGTNNVYDVQVTANDGSGRLTVQNIAVTVTPVNDNTPVFTSPATFNVPENTTAVGTTVATDADLLPQIVSYAISGGADQDKFSITGGGVLRFVTAPDYENPTDVGTNNVYEVQVTAADGNGGFTTQNIAVTVTAVNDNAPVFTSPVTFNVPENSTAVGTTLATDADLLPQAISYSLSGGVDQLKFSITSGGILTFTSAPDAENPTDAGANNVYNVQVMASDGNGGLTVQNIAVTVTPVNDNLPVFTSPATFNVAENTTAVGTTVATDADKPVQSLTFTISGGVDAGRFLMTPGGVLTFVAAPDVESPTDAGTNNVYNVQVTASDGNGGLTVQNIAVTVTPVNDNSPVFTSPVAFNVPENTTAVGATVATDADSPAQSISYSISGGADQSKFSLTSGGTLTFTSAPNFENSTDVGNNNVYNVQVTANDGNGGFTTQNIAVTVTPVNDNVPVFTSLAAFNVPENTTAVGTIVATDADAPLQSISYSLSGGADQSKFSLTSGGTLTFVSAPDFESSTDAGNNNVYNVQVTANDGNGGLTVQNIAVTVIAVNDNVPAFTSPAAFNVAENTTTVGNTVATDADQPLQSVTFAITGGADAARFLMTPGGALTFITAPDFETRADAGANSIYDVQVTANDGNGGLTTQNIAVTVTPVNEVPVFTSSATFSVPENTTAVGTTVAIDPDLPTQTVTYAITGGVDAARFLLTGTGTLTFATAPDFETRADAGSNNIYDLQVTANDGNGGLTVQNIAVTVTPVNDHVPVWTSPTTFTVPENTTTVGTMTAQDADLPAQPVTFAITGGPDAVWFFVTSGGALTFLAPPDFEGAVDAGTNNIYDLQITASDGNGGLTVQNVTVTVTAVNDRSPVFLSPATFNVPENTTAVGTTVATDADVPAQTVSYSITGGADFSRFTITPGGVLKFATAPDFESPADAGANNIYNVQVSANDGAGRSTVQNLVITVTNVDDQAPTLSFLAVSPDPRNVPIDVMQIDFGEIVTGFDLSDLSLTRNGGANLLNGSQSLATLNNISFVLTGLSGLTTADGSYVLTVNSNSGIADLAGNALASGPAESWKMDTVAPTAAINAVVPDPRTSPVGELTVVFSEPVVGFSLNSLSLTRSGGPDLLTASQTLTSADNITYTLGNLSGITGTIGTYVLSLHASNSAVQDLAGNLLSADTTETWNRVNPAVTLTVNNNQLAEAAGTSTVTVTLSATTNVDVSVVLAFSGAATLAADYSRGAALIVIPAGSTTGSLILTAVQDSRFEVAESIIVDISSVTNAVENGIQQLEVQIIDDDHAPVISTTATPSIPENTTAVLTLFATDADLPQQMITYAITGGDDQGRFSISTEGELTFQSAPNFESPADNGLNNVYEVQVTANDGQGGLTAQNITVTVTDVNDGPQLNLGGSAVTWIKRQPKIFVLPQITVGGSNSLAGGILTLSVNVVRTPKKSSDQFTFLDSSSLGSSSGPQTANGQLTLQIQLKQTVTRSDIQSFLRGITFATTGKGLKTLTRTLDVSLTDASGQFGSVRQTINVQKKA